MDDCDEILRELYTFLDASLSERPEPRSSTTSTTASTACTCTTSTPSCGWSSPRSAASERAAGPRWRQVQDCLRHGGLAAAGDLMARDR